LVSECEGEFSDLEIVDDLGGSDARDDNLFEHGDGHWVTTV
jgi:hypothetical protein